MRKKTAWDITTGAIAWDQSLAQGNPRIQLGLKFRHALLLLESETIYLLIGKLQIVFGPIGYD